LVIYIDEIRLTEYGINEADSERLTAIVENVSKNIKKYTGENDIDLLKLLKDRCAEKGLTAETVKMCRATGMYYFYRSNTMFAEDKLCQAIYAAEKIKRNDLVVAYTSELGFLHFYKHEYIKAETQYKYAEELIQCIPDLNKNILHLHYSRYGILHSSLHKFELAQEEFVKALSYAEEKTDIGFALMDIGINYKRQLDFSRALEYYDKALETFEENDYFNKSIVYNNLAELYKVIGSYDKALEYINDAFRYLGKKDATKLFIYFTTYTEIAVILKKPEKALEKFWGMLSNVEDLSVYRSYIVENIDSLAISGARNRKMLKKLETVVVKLIKFTSPEYYVYKRELARCLENIRLCIQNTNTPNGKGGLFLEKNNY